MSVVRYRMPTTKANNFILISLDPDVDIQIYDTEIWNMEWYGHVLHASDNTIVQKGLWLEVSSKGPKDELKQCWLDTLHNNMKTICLHPDHNWEKWRLQSRTVDFATIQDKC